ncbi:MAG TPA: calcium/sodium antiporter [Rhizomicrobium sp.]|nr:calcium/sodium antiporter [Rhizomicrobium sp.]
MAYWFLGGGLVLLLFGSEAIVRGGVALARAFNLSPLVIGLLVVTAGTSAPEFAVSLQAAYAGAPDIALANIVGSNILNLLLILGLAAMIRPLPSSPKVVLRDGGAMLVSAVALLAVARGGTLTRFDGLVMLAAFVLYIAAIFFSDWRRSAEHSVPCARAVQRLQNGAPQSGAAGLFTLLFGLVGLLVGAHFTVMGAEAVARMFNLPEWMIGLTAVAFGASVPELVVTVVAAARGQTHLAIGHLIGSNVFNALGALGATAALVPLPVNPALTGDLIAMAAASALIVPLLVSRWRLSRPRGALLVVAYGCYLVFLAWREGLVRPEMIGLS